MRHISLHISIRTQLPCIVGLMNIRRLYFHTFSCCVMCSLFYISSNFSMPWHFYSMKKKQCNVTQPPPLGSIKYFWFRSCALNTLYWRCVKYDRVTPLATFFIFYLRTKQFSVNQRNLSVLFVYSSFGCWSGLNHVFVWFITYKDFRSWAFIFHKATYTMILKLCSHIRYLKLSNLRDVKMSFCYYSCKRASLQFPVLFPMRCTVPEK